MIPGISAGDRTKAEAEAGLFLTLRLLFIHFDNRRFLRLLLHCLFWPHMALWNTEQEGEGGWAEIRQWHLNNKWGNPPKR